MQDSSYELLRTSLRISSEGSFLCVSVSRTIVSRSFSTRFPGIRENWKWFLTIQDFPGDFTKRRSVEDPFQDFFVCFSEYDFDAVRHKPWKQNDPDDLKRTKKCKRNFKKDVSQEDSVLIITSNKPMPKRDRTTKWTRHLRAARGLRWPPSDKLSTKSDRETKVDAST